MFDEAFDGPALGSPPFDGPALGSPPFDGSAVGSPPDSRGTFDVTFDGPVTGATAGPDSLPPPPLGFLSALLLGFGCGSPCTLESLALAVVVAECGSVSSAKSIPQAVPGGKHRQGLGGRLLGTRCRADPAKYSP